MKGVLDPGAPTHTGSYCLPCSQHYLVSYICKLRNRSSDTCLVREEHVAMSPLAPASRQDTSGAGLGFLRMEYPNS
jgi:hypothetical protein